MRIILFLVLFATLSFSNSLILSDKEINKISLDSFSGTYIDEMYNQTIEQIKNKNFQKISKTNFKATKSHIWSKFSIHNSSLDSKEIFFENSKAGIDIIDVYVFKNADFFQKIELGDMRDIKNKDLNTKRSAFYLNLEKQTTYDFYIMHESYSSISTHWYIQNRKNFIRYENIQSIVWGVFIGIIFSLCFYNLVLFFSIKEFAFLSYIFMSLSFAIYQLCVNGVAYEIFENANLQYLNNLNWFGGFLSQVFIVLFPIFFFKPEKQSLIFKFLVSALIIDMSAVFLYSFSFTNPEIRYYTKYTDFITLITISSLITTSIWALINKLPGAIFYLFGQVFYLTLVGYVVMVTIGYTESFDYIWIIVPIGIILDVIFLSLALFTKLKNIELRKKETEQLLISQARFTTMGQTIANSTHQWKTPIAQLGSQIFLLEAIYELDKGNFDLTMKETLPKIKDSIKYLNHTMDDIYNFYANPLTKESFNMSDEMESLFRMINDELKINKILISRTIDSLLYYGYKGSFLNAIMIILENSIYQLKNFKKTNRKIFISIKEINNKIILEIEDNGGGVKDINLEKLFDLNYSSKKDKGSGIGLFLAKELITKRLEGEIKVKNVNQGLLFIIILPQVK
jgi:signal transduction histidine kinase